jgi:glycosyltransferase involved in cell wall biosynthesis
MVVHQYYHCDQRVRCYAEALAAAGIQVDVLCPRDQNQSFTEQGDGIRVFTIPISRGYRGRGGYLLEYGMALILFTARLLALYIKNRYQVIHVHNMPDCLIFTALVPRILGARLILDIHDPMPEFYMSKFGSQEVGMTVRLMRLQEKFSSALAHAITVVNNVPDPKVFNRSRYKKEHRGESKHFTLIYPGTIAPRYGLDVAIRALPLLVTKIPQLYLVIVGPQVEYVNELSNLASQLGISRFVQFRPLVPVDEVPGQIIQADVGIYPALPDAHMSIATPTKVLEYAVMGIPIIASRLKILEDLFTGSAVMFFDPGNADQFAHCVLELFDNPARRDELVRNADSDFARAHSWSDERRAYFGVLNRLLPPRESVVASDERGGNPASERMHG